MTTFPYAGPCAFCGHPDKRHREIDAWVERVRAGDTPEAVAADYDRPVEWVEIAVIAAEWRRSEH